MKRKMWLVLVVGLVALMAVTPAFAYHSSVSGIVHDSKTDQPWEHGGLVTVYSCKTGATLGSGPLGTTAGTYLRYVHNRS